jgi:hypothetical protein
MCMSWTLCLPSFPHPTPWALPEYHQPFLMREVKVMVSYQPGAAVSSGPSTDPALKKYLINISE